MIIVFALSAAVLYGSADFLGGAVSRRTHVLSVLIVSAPAGAVVLLTAALAAGGPIGTAGLPRAAAAGAAGGTGLIMFYAGLAAGPMRMVAPVSALISTVLPVGVAIAGGERPGTLAYLGGGVCLVATVLVSSEGIGRRRPESRPAGPRSAPWRGRRRRVRLVLPLPPARGRLGRAVAQRGGPDHRGVGRDRGGGLAGRPGLARSAHGCWLLPVEARHEGRVQVLGARVRQFVDHPKINDEYILPRRGPGRGSRGATGPLGPWRLRHSIIV